MSVIFAEASALWAQMREDYDLTVSSYLDRAERVCTQGVVRAASPLTADRAVRLPEPARRRHVTPEFADYLDANPLPRLGEFEHQWYAAHVARGY